jgi:tRNA pseudouridine55 synthase
MTLKIEPGFEGILPIDKPKGKTSFSLIHVLRRKTGVRKIGHAGTLDPFASGVMIILVGKSFTTRSQEYMDHDKEYLATVHLGVETTTYDPEGAVTSTSGHIPSMQEIVEALKAFQGDILQVPPMFSAKKIKGKKLYELARKGIEIPRPAHPVRVETELLEYHYPFLTLKVRCSKGTYIRSIAHDLGVALGTGAHLSALVRTRSGIYRLEDCLSGELLFDY